MRTPPVRILLALALSCALHAAPPALAAGAVSAAAPDTLPSLDDLAGPPSTRFT